MRTSANPLAPEFQGRVSSAGYEWRTATPVAHNSKGHRGSRPEPASFLVDREFLGVPSTPRLYEPLIEETGLFRIFAGVEPTAEKFRAFADRYGQLGSSQRIMIGSTEARGENCTVWDWHASQLRELVGLWDLIQRQDKVRLGKIIKWVGSSRVILVGGGLPVFFLIATAMKSGASGKPEIAPADMRRTALVQTADIASEMFNSDILRRFQQPDVVKPAAYCLAFIVEQNLCEHGVSLAFSKTSSALRLRCPSLIGAIWLQFALAIDGNRQYRQCLDCKHWYETAGQAGRSDKVYCSPSCKARAHKKKTDKARRLYSQGVPMEGIARRLNTNVQTVEGWVKQ